jgi:hypothetical protein
VQLAVIDLAGTSDESTETPFDLTGMTGHLTRTSSNLTRTTVHLDGMSFDPQERPMTRPTCRPTSLGRPMGEKERAAIEKNVPSGEMTDRPSR